MTITERTKKIIQITLFILAVVALGYLLYVVFFRPAVPSLVNGNVNGLPGGFPNVNEAPENANKNGNVNEAAGIPTIERIAAGGDTAVDVLTPDTAAKDPSVGPDGKLRYYNAGDDKFYRVDAEGNITQLGSAQFADVSTVTWAPTSNEVILEFPDDSNIYYNLDTNRQVTLPKEFEEFDFSGNSSQIAFKYMHRDKERRVLAVSNPDGSEARTIEPLGEYGYRVDVDWSPTGRVIATWGEYMDLNRQELGFVGLQGENFKGTVVEGRGLKRQYSPDGMELLYSVYSQYTNYNPGLWIVDANGDDIGKNRRELNVETSAEKCAFTSDNSYVYCGVPKEPTDGWGVAEGFLKDVPDEIYRIDLKSGTKTRIAVPVDENGEAKYAVEDLVIADDGSALYFRDVNTGQLVKINL